LPKLGSLEDVVAADHAAHQCPSDRSRIIMITQANPVGEEHGVIINSDSVATFEGQVGQATLGLITRAVDDTAPETDACRTTSLSTRSATKAIGQTRELLLSGFGNSLKTQTALEPRSIAEGGKHAESREGVAAFLAKPKPNFETETNEKYARSSFLKKRTKRLL
jgi:hypothetical protein